MKKYNTLFAFMLLAIVGCSNSTGDNHITDGVNKNKSDITDDATKEMITTSNQTDKAINGSALLVKMWPYNYKLPDKVAEICYKKGSCPEIEITYMETNQDWVNNLINHQVNQIIVGDSEIKDKAVTFDGDIVKAPEFVKNFLDKFANDQIEDQSEMSYMISAEVVYLGHIDSLDLFAISSYRFLGGAHGIGAYKYIVLDSVSKKQLLISDILVVDKRDALEELLKQKFAELLVDMGYEKDHEYYDAFTLTENFSFNKDGLIFVYQPYEIMSYADGMPELTISYAELKGILKDEYLN